MASAHSVAGDSSLGDDSVVAMASRYAAAHGGNGAGDISIASLSLIDLDSETGEPKITQIDPEEKLAPDPSETDPSGILPVNGPNARNADPEGNLSRPSGGISIHATNSKANIQRRKTSALSSPIPHPIPEVDSDKESDNDNEQSETPKTQRHSSSRYSASTISRGRSRSTVQTTGDVPAGADNDEATDNKPSSLNRSRDRSRNLSRRSSATKDSNKLNPPTEHSDDENDMTTDNKSSMTSKVRERSRYSQRSTATANTAKDANKSFSQPSSDTTEAGKSKKPSLVRSKSTGSDKSNKSNSKRQKEKRTREASLDKLSNPPETTPDVVVAAAASLADQQNAEATHPRAPENEMPSILEQEAKLLLSGGVSAGNARSFLSSSERRKLNAEERRKRSPGHERIKSYERKSKSFSARSSKSLSSAGKSGMNSSDRSGLNSLDKIGHSSSEKSGFGSSDKLDASVAKKAESTASEALGDSNVEEANKGTKHIRRTRSYDHRYVRSSSKSVVTPIKSEKSGLNPTEKPETNTSKTTEAALLESSKHNNNHHNKSSSDPAEPPIKKEKSGPNSSEEPEVNPSDVDEVALSEPLRNGSSEEANRNAKDRRRTRSGDHRRTKSSMHSVANSNTGDKPCPNASNTLVKAETDAAQDTELTGAGAPGDSNLGNDHLEENRNTTERRRTRSGEYRRGKSGLNSTAATSKEDKPDSNGLDAPGQLDPVDRENGEPTGALIQSNNNVDNDREAMNKSARELGRLRSGDYRRKKSGLNPKGDPRTDNHNNSSRSNIAEDANKVARSHKKKPATHPSSTPDDSSKPTATGDSKRAARSEANARSRSRSIPRSRSRSTPRSGQRSRHASDPPGEERLYNPNDSVAPPSSARPSSHIKAISSHRPPRTFSQYSSRSRCNSEDTDSSESTPPKHSHSTRKSRTRSKSNESRKRSLSRETFKSSSSARSGSYPVVDDSSSAEWPESWEDRDDDLEKGRFARRQKKPRVNRKRCTQLSFRQRKILLYGFCFLFAAVATIITTLNKVKKDQNRSKQDTNYPTYEPYIFGGNSTNDKSKGKTEVLESEQSKNAQQLDYPDVCPMDFSGTVPIQDCLGYIYCKDGEITEEATMCPPDMLFDFPSESCELEESVICNYPNNQFGLQNEGEFILHSENIDVTEDENLDTEEVKTKDSTQPPDNNSAPSQHATTHATDAPGDHVVPTVTDPPPSTTTTPRPWPYFLTLKITFDENPEDIGWKVTSLMNNLPLAYKSTGSYSHHYAHAVIFDKVPIYGRINGIEEHTYRFVIEDSEGNGLCCKHGHGSYEVFYGDISDDNQALISGSEFAFTQVHEVTIRN